MLQTMPVQKTEITTSWENYKCEGPRIIQPTKVHIQTCLTCDLSTLTRKMYNGSSRPDPHEARTSWATRSVAGRVGSGQQALKSRGSGRVGSADPTRAVRFGLTCEQPCFFFPDYVLHFAFIIPCFLGFY